MGEGCVPGRVGNGNRGSGVLDLDFDGATMVNAMGRDVESGKVSLVISPLLAKWGDVNGENFDKTKVIGRRLVVCEEDAVVYGHFD